MFIKTIAEALAAAIAARLNCIRSGNTEWQAKHEATIARIVDVLPSGSGIDTGTSIDLARSTPDKLVLSCSYHHMSPDGMYDGWTDHTIIVRPSFIDGLTVTVSGRDRNEIKDYLASIYTDALRELAETV